MGVGRRDPGGSGKKSSLGGSGKKSSLGGSGKKRSLSGWECEEEIWVGV